MSELRYHPYLKTWVITATHRQDRTYHPPPGFCPLCPTKPGEFETEIPLENYDIVVFENKFPSVCIPALEQAIDGSNICPVRPSEGICEVICYSSDHNATFATLPISQIRKLTRVWKERYIELASNGAIEYIFIFENKGEVIGVTLSHPHGQIYAYPFIPLTAQTELSAEKGHFETTGRLLAEDWLEFEIEESKGNRVLFENDTFLALVPFFARYTYEVHVVAKTSLNCLKEFGESELDDLANALYLVAKTFDQLFGFSLPYIMAMHQYDAPWSRFHVEFYPPNRSAEKLKYLAGSEAGAGAFINDLLPEEAAENLRSAFAKISKT
jgi:UDPglucose--hexose-1-phosphate uridylyltransferase